METTFRFMSQTELTGVMLRTTVILAIGQLLAILYKAARTHYSLPPGPQGHPFWGMLLKMSKEFYLVMQDFSKEMGSIVSFRMGRQIMVSLNDYRLIREAMRSDKFIFRPYTQLFEFMRGYGIINTDGKLWKSQRTFLLQTLMIPRRNVGKRVMACLDSERNKLLLNILSRLKVSEDGCFAEAEALHPNPIVNAAVGNVIFGLVTSKTFEHDDPGFLRFMHLFDEGFRLFSTIGVVIFQPWMRFLPGVRKTLRRLEENRQELLAFVRQTISEHMEKSAAFIEENGEPEEPQDLVEAYLAHLNDPKTSESFRQKELHGVDPMGQLEQVALDLMSAGTETLKTSLLWSLIYMMHNPEVKAKVQQELDLHIREDQLPEQEDMAKCTYVRATICEVLRRSSILALATTHSCNRDVDFAGYRIPKNAHVIPNLYSVHMNPELFEDPEQFKPERFLSEDGEKLVKPEYFMPFGVGKRACLGEKLAEKEFFIIFASIFKMFDVRQPEGEPLPSLTPVQESTLIPRPFKVEFWPRTDNVASKVVTMETLSKMRSALQGRMMS